jgi:hypothetical protein
MKKDLKGVFRSLQDDPVWQHLCQFIITHFISDLQAQRFSLSPKEGAAWVDNGSKLVVIADRYAV